MDDLRERVAELAGIDLVDFLEEGKGSWGGGQAQGGKGKTKVRYRPWLLALSRRKYPTHTMNGYPGHAERIPYVRV